MKLPYKVNPQFELLLVAVASAPALASVYFYRRFPDRVPTHWNASGQADGWSGPEFAAFFFPALIFGLYLLLLLLPVIDPQKDRYREFGRAYRIMRLAVVAFLSVIYFVSSLIGIGHDIPINRIILPSLGVMFITLGNFMPKFKKNWFVGIRTPWTLSSEKVWNQTHRLGGKAFMAVGAACLLATFASPKTSFTLVVGTAIGASLLTAAYSWWLWRNLPPHERDVTPKVN